MPNAISTTIEIAGSREEILWRAQRVLEDAGMTAISMDAQRGRLTAVTHRSWRSWGEVITVALHEGHADRTQVRVRSEARVASTLIDFGKNRANVQLVLRAIEQISGSGQASPSVRNRAPTEPATDLPAPRSPVAAGTPLPTTDSDGSVAPTNQDPTDPEATPAPVADDLTAAPTVVIAPTEPSATHEAQGAGVVSTLAAAAAPSPLRDAPATIETLRFDSPIYAGADAAGASLYAGRAGESFEVVAILAHFAAVQTPSGRGFVPLTALGIEAEAPPADGPKILVASPTPDVYQMPTYAQMRYEAFVLEQPRLGGPVIGRAGAGEEFRVTRLEGDFACVDVGRRRGFIRADALGFDIPPPVPATPTPAAQPRSYSRIDAPGTTGVRQPAGSAIVQAREGASSGAAAFLTGVVTVFVILGVLMAGRAAAPNLANQDCWQLQGGQVGIRVFCAGNRDAGGWCAGLVDISSAEMNAGATACATPALVLEELSVSGMLGIAVAVGVGAWLLVLLVTGRSRTSRGEAP